MKFHFDTTQYDTYHLHSLEFYTLLPQSNESMFTTIWTQLHPEYTHGLTTYNMTRNKVTYETRDAIGFTVQDGLSETRDLPRI